MDIRAHVISLNENRLRVINELRGVLDATLGRDRNEEEKANIARLDQRIMDIDAERTEFIAREIREQESAALMDAQFRAFGEPAAPQGRQADPNAELRAFLRGTGGAIGDNGARYMEVDLRGAMKERQLLRSGASAEEIRALAWDTGSSGSLVPSSVSRTLYQYLEANNGIFNAPTTKIVTSTGENIPFQKLGAHAIATQVSGQGTLLAGTDPTFLKMTLGAFKYGELVIIANELMSDSVIDIGEFIGRDIGRALGRVTATALTVGSGSGAPNGIMTAILGAATIATGGSLILPTVEKLIDLKYSVADAYRSDPSCGWLMNDSTAGTLSKIRDGAGGTVGAFLWRPSLTQGLISGAPDVFLDKPVYIETNVAAQASNAKTVAFGAMSAYYIRTVGNVMIESDSSRYFDTDQTGVRGKMRLDGNLIDTTAVNCIKQSV